MKEILFTIMVILLLNSCYNQSEKYESWSDYPPYPVQDLGADYSPEQTTFNLWAPTASYAELLLYREGTRSAPIKVINMTKASDSPVWSVSDGGDMDGLFYTFRVQVDSIWYNETPGIWAKAVGVNGQRAAIVDMKKTDPQGWEEDKRPELESFADIIIYELHHRDMTVSPTSGIKNKGKFVAWTENGTKSPQGEPTGIDHLVDLGITHVHILPSFDYGSIDEETLYLNKYNWGYDPLHYNVPEGSYSTDPYKPETRIREFKEMIQSFHKHGIRVIMDVVYNHTYRLGKSCFTNTVPGYFYRQWPDSVYSDASGCGNETASEREMMRRYIIESCKYWIREYHVDGFRFDLMGIHDLVTMNELRSELNDIDPTLFLYGEGWTAGNSPYPISERAMKTYAYRMPGIGVYNDDIRDGLKGEVSNDAKRGFVSGREGMEETVKFGIVGAIAHPGIDYSKVLYSDSAYASQPVQSINYVSCHDDLCLTDKLRISVPEATEEELIAMDKLAQTVVLTSQGVPFIFCGEEVFRNKKSVHNSFESPDSINQIDWNFKYLYKDVYLYYKNMIALRKAHPAFRMGDGEMVRKYLKFDTHKEKGVVAYMIDGRPVNDCWEKIMVILNAGKKEVVYPVPYEQWRVAVENGTVSGDSAKHRLSYDFQIRVAPVSATILYVPAPKKISGKKQREHQR